MATRLAARAGCWLLAAGCWLLSSVCCPLPAACYLLHAACYLLPGACCLQSAACCLLPATCCLLLTLLVIALGSIFGACCRHCLLRLYFKTAGCSTKLRSYVKTTGVCNLASLQACVVVDVIDGSTLVYIYIYTRFEECIMHSLL